MDMLNSQVLPSKYLNNDKYNRVINNDINEVRNPNNINIKNLSTNVNISDSEELNTNKLNNLNNLNNIPNNNNLNNVNNNLNNIPNNIPNNNLNASNNLFTSGVDNTLKLSINGIFLLILTVASNFNAETLSCRAQRILSERMYIKHILNLILIYFAVNLTSDDILEHPVTLMKRSVLVWIGFILFSRMNIKITGIVFLLLTIGYTLGNFVSYHKQKNNKKRETYYSKLQQYIFTIIPFVILIGFIIYYKEKHEEYKDVWSPIIFLFGRTTCRNT